MAELNRQRPVWPIAALAAVAAPAATAEVYLWATGRSMFYLIGAVAVVVMLVLYVRKDILEDVSSQKRQHVAVAAAIMGAGIGLLVAGIAVAVLADGFTMPAAGALIAGTGYWALRRQRIRLEVPA